MRGNERNETAVLSVFAHERFFPSREASTTFAGVFSVIPTGRTYGMEQEKLDFSAPQPTRRIFTVSRLTKEIGRLLESEFPLVWLEGEISNFRAPTSGHLYFSLKDSRSQIRGVMFQHQNQYLSFQPKDGMAVVGLGRIAVYEARGEYQIVFETLEPKGRGELQLAFEELKRRLSAEGLFDNARKKPLPFLPRHVVVITSPTGAAIRDFIQVLGRRYANMEISIYPVRVQGSEASYEIARAIREVNLLIPADVIVLTRGGGSLEDLWPFNTEDVARAVSASDIPVLSAVGHEIDTTISDLVADKRAPTPSAAAEILVPLKEDLLGLVERLEDILERRTASFVNRDTERLQGLMRGIIDPRRYVEQLNQRLDDQAVLLGIHARNYLSVRTTEVRSLTGSLNHRALSSRCETYGGRVAALKRELELCTHHYMEEKSHTLNHGLKGLSSADPSMPLKRGYSITRRLPERGLVTHFHDVAPGDEVTVKLGKGQLFCKIERAEDDVQDRSRGAVPPIEPGNE